VIERVISWLVALPPWLLYTVIGTGAGVENVVPPIPADTFVLLGAVLAEAGRASPRLVFFWTWFCNILGAVMIYALAHRYGNRFFGTPAGHWLLHPRQLEQIGRFYARWGWPAIFLSRFLPGLRAVVPVFAGVAGVRAHVVVLPVAVASAIWYGFLVWIGATMGRNWGALMALMERIGLGLLLVALLLAGAIAYWWLRSRRG
jgi:membrane protein DedA with SNARE-associated domain